ncbi:hypothetical protein GIS00_04550 [Nakamurella sp. YIM 132087]|uniref:ABC transporter permease n=1 Tax=Nakamurella alba TaxID=2665158 RepID=A0A7K1FGN0_9ACTN|nr:ABC transporter permease [Nakamurella alba]MTD13216.1 hypothetical protein [Nakamurella alba]
MSTGTTPDAATGAASLTKPSPAGEGGTGAPAPKENPVGRAGRAVFAWFGTRQLPVIVLLSVITGLVISSVLVILTSEPLRVAWGGFFRYPGNALSKTGDQLGSFYSGLFKGSIVDPTALGAAFSDPSTANWRKALTPFANTITAAVPLAIAGVGLSICYRAGAFNIGSHAQIVGGGIGASWVGFSWPDMPWLPHVLLAFLAAAIGGAICGLIPGLLKAWTGASEVIVTIMLNYVLANFLIFLLSSTFFKVEGRGIDNPIGKTTVESASLTSMFPAFPVNAGLVVALLVVIFASLLLSRSRLGFEMQIAGAGTRAATVAGIKGKAVFVSAFVISGAVIGLAGGVQVLGVSHQLAIGFGTDIGTIAILVAFVGNISPWGAAAAALLYGALQAGGISAQLASGVSYQLTGVMQALIVMFVTAPALIAAIYRLRLRTSFLGGVR